MPRMAFCPIPHTARDQVWLAAGVGIGLSVAWYLRQRDGWDRAYSTTPCVLREPPTVVKTATMQIDEIAGGASNGEPRLSMAHVRVAAATTEAIQIPDFDEYVLVLNGVMHVDVGHADVAKRPRRFARAAPVLLVAKSGETFWLPRGQRYKYWFPGACEYVAICMPAFHPSRATLQTE
ncbi:hypothetical protein T492DRAFT_1074253 [Pavlovales sp. CCMP2436]|nr:hypothetical protein T492DRAFT_1074253 [Pavlovales sp. CCMP2436]